MKDLLFVLRIFKRNPLIFAANTIGLGIALTSVILTMTYIRFELSYDRHFATRDRVVRLYSRVTDNASTRIYGISLRNAYTQLPERVPEIESAVQLYGGVTNVQTKETKLEKIGFFYTDNEFFRVFGLSLRYGDVKTALVGRNCAVITVPVAEKLFKTANCVGKAIEIDDMHLLITGVMDEIPRNSHLTFGTLVSSSTLNFNWFGGLEFQTYYLLKPHVNLKAAGDKIAAANNILMRDWAKGMNARVESGVEPLTSLYLHSVASLFIPNHGSPKQMVIVGLIALFVLVTAMLSYINLFIIQGEKRIAEISTRSLFGATKAGIARLFFLETFIVFLLSALLAFLITYKSLPYISGLLQSEVTISDLFSRWGMLPVLLVLACLLVITSGYPVFYLSRMKYALGLRGKISGKGNNNLFSMSSVFVQFAVTAFFIICIVIILAQLVFMHHVPLGFEKENVTAVNNCSMTISKKYESIRAELLKLPFITAVSGGEHFMGGGCSGQYIRNTWEGETSNKAINEYREKPGFGELMKFHLVDGRFFRQSMADSHAVVLNESAARLLGIKPKAGQTVVYRDERAEVIGVVKDFYYMSNPGEPIEPLVISNCFWGTPCIYIRSTGPFSESQVLQVGSVFQRFDHDFIFNHSALSDIFENMYRKENRLAKMAFIGGVQVAVITLISLLALTILKISRRTREIGIRKVNGSSVGRVIASLLNRILAVVLAATVFASLASYLVMSRWLTDYALHLRLHAGYFIAGSLFVLFIAIAATIWQAWWAASRNPVEALRYE